MANATLTGPKADEATYHRERMARLVGATITVADVALDDSDPSWPELWPILKVTLTDGTEVQLEISRDPEGNGPGHIFIGGE
ncbi:MAG TPA: hypothetical protein VMW08_00395 [Acidimicrobiales bacterium]|nr:hypothetical protein [Acidimicrobiales bacterium]